jgi:hypothetical protein
MNTKYEPFLCWNADLFVERLRLEEIRHNREVHEGWPHRPEIAGEDRVGTFAIHYLKETKGNVYHELAVYLPQFNQGMIFDSPQPYAEEYVKAFGLTPAQTLCVVEGCDNPGEYRAYNLQTICDEHENSHLWQSVCHRCTHLWIDEHEPKQGDLVVCPKCGNTREHGGQ